MTKETKEEKKILGLQDRLNAIAAKNATVIADKPIPRVMIGVPILAWSHRFATSFLEFWTELMTYQHKGRAFEVCYNFKYRRPVHIAEEELAENAVESGCTHLLLMDDDIYDVTVKDFLALLDADKDVIGGIMYTSGFPHALCAFRRFNHEVPLKEQPNLVESCRLYEMPPDQRVGVQLVDLIPFGFTMIKTSVFEKIEKPWFRCDASAPTDSWFADSILGAGLQYFAHFGVWLCHNEVTRENQPLKMQLGMLEAQKQKSGRVIELTPEEMSIHETMMRKKMLEAEKSFIDDRIKHYKFMRKDEASPIGVPVEYDPSKKKDISHMKKKYDPMTPVLKV